VSRKFSLETWISFAILLFLSTVRDQAQTAAPQRLILQPIDETKLVRLTGNTRREANRQNDLGRVENDLHLDMYLQLKRSPEQELAAKQFVESLTDKTSANFQKWIKPEEYGRRFGAAPEDIETVSHWLKSHGFVVNRVPANNMVIDFSGSAAQVTEALHTEIHYINVAGKRVFANMSDPQIPAALVPAVTGVVSLSSFQPRPMYTPKSQYTVSSNTFPVVPGDLATIYNLNPAFAGGYTGRGQTVVVVEDTDLYSGTGDWNVFRTTFGLDRFTYGSLTQVHPAPGQGSACVDPGINGDDAEAAIDVEWASAAAPDAAIVMASCEDTTNFGGFIALQNMLTNGGSLPSVVSISYGESETDAGTAGNSYINTLYQTAAAAGVSIFVSSGDEAAAETDHRSEVAIHGISVSAFTSTPYNVSVGGTDFGDVPSGTSAAFWNSTNGIYYDSAKGYVTEIPWNESCASQVLATYHGFSSTFGASGYCNSSYNYLRSVGGSGGPSGCVTGSPVLTGVIGGTCAGYPKPSWQSIPGNPNDGVRDIPDVSLFAASGLWGHYYVFCFSDGGGCTGVPSNWAGAGGTSFASPIMAGIQAVINQALGTTNVGNPNPVYYEIGQSEYGTSPGSTACNSSAGPASTCSFNDITQGDIDIPCAGAFDCFLGGGGLGVLSTSNTSFAPAYAAGPGWDFATGIGTVNASNLLTAFVNSITPSTAPPPPVLLSPADQATDVSPVPVLNWNASNTATSYDVFFGTALPPPLVTNTATLNYAPGTLSAATTYYWAVGAKNSLGENVSTPFSFTTSCVAALAQSGATVAAAGGTGTIPVTATPGCAWSAASQVAWITITSGVSGNGSGIVAYTVAADTGAQRSGSITIEGQAFTVTEGGISPLISTLAGGSMPATASPGTALSIPVSYGVAVDASGSAYFPSPLLNAVFKADPAGVVTRIAGNGLSGYSGDNGPALNAQLNAPNGVAVDSLGNVYIADSNNDSIRKVSTSGVITTVAGSGMWGYSGDTGPAIAAQFAYPTGVAVDSAGNLYIADTYNYRIRQVNAAGVIATVAGNGTYGYSGDAGPAISAELGYVFNVAVDAGGNLYVADENNNRVRKVDTSGTITTFAGTGTCCYSGDGGPATSARLAYPYGVALDTAGNLYIADTDDSRIRMVNAAGKITTVAGNGVFGSSGDGGAPTSAQLADPQGVAADSSGNLYIADTGGARIRKVAGGIITTLAGGAINDGGMAVFGFFNQPSGVARDNAGNTYIADTGNDRVRKVTAAGAITTVAGTGAPGFAGDGGAATAARLYAPQGLALDAAGNLYIADTSNYRVRKLDGAGNISTVAGNGSCCSTTGDGAAATGARIGQPYGLAVDSAGDLYISDINNNVIRKVNASGIITTVAGAGSYGYSGDGGPATRAKLDGPYGLAVDAAGSLYIADRYNNRVRKVDGSGNISTVAGDGTCCFGGDGGPATNAELCSPTGLAVDAAGNLYIADSCNERIRRVDTGGTITTLAGNGSYGYSGDGGLATGAAFRSPDGISMDAAGNMAVTDQGDNAIRLLMPEYTQPVLTIQSAHASAFTEGQSGATYTVTVSNSSGAASTNGTVTVTEVLPSGLNLAAMAGSGWTCSAPSAPTCTRSDALSGGSSYPPIIVTVNVDAAALSQLTAQVSVSGGSANVAGTEDLTIVAPASAPTASAIHRRP
jgi:uncharacterized repeat protein (TIGR01451 family)